MKMPLCTRCGTRNAAFVCQNCGRMVCHDCFDRNRWWCGDCINHPSTIIRTTTQIPTAGLFFLAFVMIFVGILLMSLGPILSGNGVGSFGTVILIGPIPVILGSGPLASVMIILALVLTVVAVIVGVILQRSRRKL